MIIANQTKCQEAEYSCNLFFENNIGGIYIEQSSIIGDQLMTTTTTTFNFTSSKSNLGYLQVDTASQLFVSTRPTTPLKFPSH